MRIIAGRWRGLRLAEVGRGDTGAHLRPTSDRVRESLFNLLQNGRQGDRVADAHVLDLFAGTGALGLEALSRGAAHATFIDKGRAAGKLLTENIAKTRSQDQTTVLTRDATAPGPCPAIPASLVFIDPPYGKELGELALTAAGAGGWIAPGALIVWEENAPVPAPPGFRLLDTRRYGDTHLTLLEAAPD